MSAVDYAAVLARALAMSLFAAAGELAAGSAGAQEPERITVFEAVDRALAAYPALAVARARGDAAEAAVGQAAALRWPRLTFSYSATRYEEPMLVTPIHGFTAGEIPPFDRTLFQGAANLEYTLFDGGARGARIREARSVRGAADAEVERGRQAVVAAVVMAYVETLGASGVLEAWEHQIASLEAELARVRQLRDVGRAARVEVLRLEAALAAATAERVRAAAGLDLAARELARLIGSDPARTRPHELVPVALSDPRVPARDSAVAGALAASPDVAVARHELEAADAGLSVARGARWPRLDFGGAYVHRGSAAGDFTGEWNVGLRLYYPVFTGGEVRHAIGRADAMRRAAREGVEQARLASARAVDHAISAVEEADARLRSLRIAAERSEEVVRIERLRLETGTGTQTDYLAAEAELMDARAARIQAEHAAIAARVELARAMGELDAGWLRRNLEHP